MHAPTGSFAANPWGFHDILGNVAEWCRDAEHGYEVPPRRGDGLRGDDEDPGAAAFRIHRGGHFQSPASGVRCADRGKNQDVPSNTVGLRPARRLRSE